MRGGWQGPMGTVGGVSRTYGLKGQFDRPERERARFEWRRIRRVVGYFKPYRWSLLLVLLCIGATAVLSVLPPFCVRYILDDAIPAGDHALLGWLAAAMVGITVLASLVGVVQQTLTARTGQGIMFDLRNELYRHLQGLSLHFYTTTRSGEIISRLNNDVNAVQGVATGTLVGIVSNVATLLTTSVALFAMHWQLALVAIIVVPLFYLPSRVVGRIRRRLTEQTQERQAHMVGFMHERLHVGGMVLSRICGRDAADAGEFAARTGEVRDLSIKQAVVGRWLFSLLSVFSTVGPALVYAYGGILVIREEFSVGLLVAFAALLTLLYRPMMQLASVYVDCASALAVFQRLFSWLDIVPSVRDPAEPRTLAGIREPIVFEHVGFAYPTRDRRRDPAEPMEVAGIDEGKEVAAPTRAFALTDVDFRIEPGQRVALVGPSGAGKSTITLLLPRFYDPDRGSIRIGDTDLRELRQADLRRHIGMVTQETFLFHDTIRANLLYARPDADEEAIVAACRAASIHTFIVGLPQGYDTIVGERGVRLSGGEKQRVAIARALLQDPDLLILDEATSSLDATSEHLVQQALDTLLQGRTSLIIAHRLSTILTADQIIVLDEGSVVERGTHAELLEREGLYAELYRQQFADVLAG